MKKTLTKKLKDDPTYQPLVSLPLAKTRTIRFYQSLVRANQYANRMTDEALARSDAYYSVITISSEEALLEGLARFQNHECNLLQIVGDGLVKHGWNIRDAEDVVIEFDESYPTDEAFRLQAVSRIYRTTLPPSTTTKQ